MRSLGVILLLLPFGLFAQNKTVSKPGWRMTTATGLVTGETNTRAVFQISGGLVYRHHFAGIGFGYDMYGFNSFPLFAGWNMDFGRKRIGFLYAHAGYSLPGHYKKDEEFSKTADRLRGGFYMDAGIGYRFHLGSFNHLSFSAGYSRKDLTHKETFTFCTTGDCAPDIHEYKYRYGRMIAKLSWELGY
jgi:hypothetical protein